MVDRPEVPLDELYCEVVMGHYRRPRGRAPLAHVDARAHGFNPVCGDDVYLNLALANDHIEGVQLEGRGCAICTASGSMMAELLAGRPITEAQTVAESFRGMMHGEPLVEEHDIGDLEALQGVQKFAVRVKCAMLPWVTLQDALRAWRNGAASAESSTENEEARQ
jgi:nitrogen fixation protein NifU and related proteins